MKYLGSCFNDFSFELPNLICLGLIVYVCHFGQDILEASSFCYYKIEDKALNITTLLAVPIV